MEDPRFWEVLYNSISFVGIGNLALSVWVKVLGLGLSMIASEFRG